MKDFIFVILGREMMRYFYILICGLIFLVGCNNEDPNESIRASRYDYDFILAIETDKGVYEEGETVTIPASFTYIGEGINLSEEPKLTVLVRNMKDRKVVKEEQFKDVRKTMLRGEMFAHEIEPLDLEKGTYEASLGANYQIGSMFTSIGSGRIQFKVK